MKEGNLVFDINGEFITEITREWFYTGEKSYETVMKILMDSMTGTDTPEARRRTQYGRRELRDEQSNFNGTFNKRSRGEIHLRGKFIGNCQIHAGSR